MAGFGGAFSVTSRTRPEMPSGLRASTVTSTAPETSFERTLRFQLTDWLPARSGRPLISVVSGAPEEVRMRTVARAGRSSRNVTPRRGCRRLPTFTVEPRALSDESVRSTITRRRCSVSPLPSSGVCLTTT